MLSENVKVGDRLEIALRRNKKLGDVYLSRVEEILHNGSIVVYVPISYGQIVRLPKGAQYSTIFFTEKGMLHFDASIEYFVEDAGFKLMTLKLNSEGERIQRRDFFRFSCLLPVKFTVVNEDEVNEDEVNEDELKQEDVVDKNQMYEGIVKDLGGGGIRFVSNELIEEESKIKCVILLNEDYVIVIGRLLHRQHFPKSAYKYQYRAVFIGILPEEQDKIVQYIFSEQRKSLQKNISL